MELYSWVAQASSTPLPIILFAALARILVCTVVLLPSFDLARRTFGRAFGRGCTLTKVQP